MTSCPLSLKAIPAQNSLQRDINHPLEKMSTKIPLQREKERQDREKEKERRKKDLLE
jgi:hypothetical protein